MLGVPLLVLFFQDRFDLFLRRLVADALGVLELQLELPTALRCHEYARGRGANPSSLRVRPISGQMMYPSVRCSG